jgi:hypothetical protein
MRNVALVGRYLMNHPEAWVLLVALLLCGARMGFTDWWRQGFWVPMVLLGLAMWGIYGLVNIEERYVTVAYQAVILPVFAALITRVEAGNGVQDGTSEISGMSVMQRVAAGMAALLGQRIVEVPTTLKKDGRSRPPHLRTWRDGWRHLRFLLMYSPRWLFLFPGLALMAIGLGLTVWLLPAERPLGHVNLGVDTLAYAAAAVLLGFQLVFFGVAAKVFAITEGLLPEDESFSKWFQYITLETGLITGVVLVLVGVGIAVSSVVSWAHTGYGSLPPVEMMRRTLPAMLCLMLGTEICFASFFLSLLGLKRRIEV